MFKRKRWVYLILDEAHMIKNWKSQRWQTLLNFQSSRRLLLTGRLVLCATAAGASTCASPTQGPAVVRWEDAQPA